MKRIPTTESLALLLWAETGQTPTAHVSVGKLNGSEIKRCVRDVPTEVLRRPADSWTNPPSPYVAMARAIELTRRGPPSGWRGQGVVGWLCFDAKEGWRPILAGQGD